MVEGNASPGRFFPVASPDIGPLETQYVLDALQSGWVSSMGLYVNEFEMSFAAYCEARHGVSTSSGTTALHLALASLGVGPEDEVIVPALTFVATANAVRYTGATPVFIDSEPETWCMDPSALERARTPRTRAIIVVHIYGHPADMDPILSFSTKWGIPVIEDAAESHGALYKGRKVGAIGRMGVFSFYGNKIITTGEGGMVVTDDEGLAERIRFLRDHAMSPERRYWHTEVGYNYRLTNLQAALGVAQLRRIDDFLARRNKILGWYRELLDIDGIVLNPALPWASPSCWLVCALLPAAISREDVMAKLRARGVDTRPFFCPLNTLPPFRGQYKAIYKDGDGCPTAADLAGRGINLPTDTRFEREDVKQIVQILRKVLSDA